MVQTDVRPIIATDQVFAKTAYTENDDFMRPVKLQPADADGSFLSTRRFHALTTQIEDQSLCTHSHALEH